jgi:hypothetical protein
MTHTIRKNIINFIFGISTLQFLIKKIKIKKFFPDFFGHQNPGSGSGINESGSAILLKSGQIRS